MAASSQDRIPELQVRRGIVSRPVAVAGAVLGTVIAIIAMTDGARLRLGGMPQLLGAFFGALLLWALIVAASVVLAEMTRRHHKTAARYAARQGSRGAAAGGQALRRQALRFLDTAADWAGPRWHTRTARTRSVPDEVTPTVPSPVSPSADNAEVSQPEGETPMTTPARGLSRITPGRRAQHVASRNGGTVPAPWGALVAEAADFDPENDGHLLDWMGGETNGMAAYGEALVEVYEGLTRDKGADARAAAAIHDVADAIAHAAEMMAAAKKKFAEHYDQPREFAANGGVMTHDGRWITGEGE
jgi:hypothetical protein